jgi:hypothetical protein
LGAGGTGLATCFRGVVFLSATLVFFGATPVFGATLVRRADGAFVGGFVSGVVFSISIPSLVGG